MLGFHVNGRRFAGTAFDWVHPFVLAVGVGLVFGYVLLGATWIVMKSEGALRAWAQRVARIGWNVTASQQSAQQDRIAGSERGAEDRSSCYREIQNPPSG